MLHPTKRPVALCFDLDGFDELMTAALPEFSIQHCKLSGTTIDIGAMIKRIGPAAVFVRCTSHAEAEALKDIRVVASTLPIVVLASGGNGEAIASALTHRAGYCIIHGPNDHYGAEMLRDAFLNIPASLTQ